MGKGRELQATIKLLGKMDPSVSAALNKAEKMTSSANKRLMNMGGAALKVTAQAATAVAGAAASAAAAIGTASLKSYASFEQLSGGVKAIMGDEIYPYIQGLADDAYATAGISSNAYLDQVTSFSASLMKSLGGDTQAAVDRADMAIKDMSDNANRMGTDIETVQATYQSLMRGSYAMLDNLRLGYGGTKEEMEKLVADASKLTGEALDPENFGDVIKAIHAVQENLGITGATADEAATTIEGSVNSMKAAWSNWLTGLGNEDADMSQLTDNLVKSIDNVAKNVLPRINQIAGQMMESLPDMLAGAASKIAPVLSEALAGAWNMAVSALGSLGIQLPNIDAGGVMSALSSAMESIKPVIEAVGPPLTNLANAVLPPLFSAISNIIPLISAIATAILPPLINYITPIASVIANIAAAVLPMLTSAVQFLTPVIQAVLPIVMGLIGAFNGVLGVVNSVRGIFTTVASQVMPAVNSAIASMYGPIQSAASFFSGLFNAIQPVLGALGSIISLAGRAAAKLAEIGGSIIGGIGGLLGFATGGFTAGPSIAGEDPRYPTEAVISFNPAYRAQNLRYWAMAGHMLGARSGGSSSTSSGGGGGSISYDLSGMTFSPNVIVRGNASKDDIVAAIMQCEGDFMDFVMDALARREEAAYV